MNQERAKKVAGEWAVISKVFAAMGDPNRQMMLLLFDEQEELSIKSISECFPLSKTAVGHHLNVLRNSGILKERRVGKETLLSVDRQLLIESLEATLIHIKNPNEV